MDRTTKFGLKKTILDPEYLYEDFGSVTFPENSFATRQTFSHVTTHKRYQFVQLFNIKPFSI